MSKTDTTGNDVGPNTEEQGTEEKVPWVLFPGDWLALKMGAKDPESRILLRMFLNLAIYSKIAGTIIYFYFFGF